MGQIRGIREKGKKRGRKGAADSLGSVRVSIFLEYVLICEKGTGKSVRK